jgi:penicillin-binding protein 1A
MRKFLTRRFQSLTATLYRSLWRFVALRPFMLWSGYHITRIRQYLHTHRKARLALLIAGPVMFLVFLLYAIVWIETPGARELGNIQNQVASEVYSADSVLLGRYFLQDRTEIRFQDIAPSVVDALIATEDIRFYEHSGVDWRSLGRVIVKSIIQQDESSGGGSTLTQQLAKNLYPRRRYWILPMLINKLREVRIARKLESLYTKDELLTLYLNTVPFADNVFGIEAAAERFYSTSAKKLTVDQAALLIGMLKATHSYNPRLFPGRALVRRNVVLNQLVKYKKLDSTQAEALKKLPVELEYNKVSHHEGLAPYFREQLKAELENWCSTHQKADGSPYNLYTDGLKVYTTLDATLQQYAEKAMVQQMTEIQKTFHDHWGKDQPWKGNDVVLEQAIQRTARYQNLQQQGLSEEEIMTELQKPVPTLMFSWQGVREVNLSPIDSIIHHLKFLNAGFLAVDPATGGVKVWVGGIDHDFFQYDHVKVSTKRQVGSIFKPFVFAAALEEGVEPCELFPAEIQTYIDKEGEKWTPRDSQLDYGVDYSMRGALAYSVNTVAVKLIDIAGVDRVIAMARNLGISSEMPEVPSLSLGVSSISLMEMTGAYTGFANDGVALTPFYVNSIHDLEGKIYEDLKPPRRTTQAMKKETCQLVRRMMGTVVEEGTASRIRWRYGIYNDLAGKTGTTQANADGWFMAVTPKLVMGAWVGADDPRIRFRTTELGQGANTALPITGYFMKQVNADKKFKDISNARFPTLPADLQKKLECDLYELDEMMKYEIERMIAKRDSLIQADTTVAEPPETFLQMLYKRKMKMLKAIQHLDSLKALDILEGETQ